MASLCHYSSDLHSYFAALYVIDTVHTYASPVFVMNTCPVPSNDSEGGPRPLGAAITSMLPVRESKCCYRHIACVRRPLCSPDLPWIVPTGSLNRPRKDCTCDILFSPSAQECKNYTSNTGSENICYRYEYGPSSHKRDSRISKISISSISSSLEFWGHESVCLSTPFFAADPIAKLADHISTDIHPTVPSGGSNVGRTSPNVNRRCP